MVAMAGAAAEPGPFEAGAGESSADEGESVPSASAVPETAAATPGTAANTAAALAVCAAASVFVDEPVFVAWTGSRAAAFGVEVAASIAAVAAAPDRGLAALSAASALFPAAGPLAV
jgi:hypothetical protein